MSIDKQRVGNSFARHYGQYEDAAVVQRDMADRLAAALAEHAPQLTVHRALEIGIGTGFLTRHLTTRFPEAEWWFNDLTPAAFDWIPVGLKQALTLEGDAETLPYPHGLDLLASASALQWFDDLEGFFPKARSVMNAGGVLALASFGNRHFHELAAVADSPLHYPSPADFAAMAKHAGFTILHAEDWEETLLFASARDLLDHLRRTGVNGAAARRLSTPAQLRAFEADYRAAHPREDGALPLTYHAILLLASAQIGNRIPEI